MADGLQLAAAWVARVFSWAVVLPAAALVAFGAAAAYHGTMDWGMCQWTMVGVGVVSAAWYANAWGTTEIQRQADERNERAPRGFDVVHPYDPSHRP